MSLFTSSQFAATCAHGSDWREVSKTVLEALEEVKTGDADFNFGFLYISDHLNEHATSILNLFKSVLQIENWVGANGIGVFGCDQVHVDKPAISAMIGRFDEDSFHVFPPFREEQSGHDEILKGWLNANDPMLVLAHGDPLSEDDPALLSQDIAKKIPGFLIGGMSSSRQAQIQIADDLHENGMCGVAFSDRVKVASTLSQGCAPIGDIHTITKSDERTILELDERKAVEVFEDDLRDMAISKVGKDPSTIIVDPLDIENAEDMPIEFQSLMKGDVHVAFPISESDQGDYLVRNIAGLDSEEGSIDVTQFLSNGERMMFVHRDAASVREDLSKSLLKLRKRVMNDEGDFQPKGAIYISCAGRAGAQFGGDEQDEIALIREIIGDVPLCGFYAGGEILNARIYGYTGILTLFL